MNRYVCVHEGKTNTDVSRIIKSKRNEMD